MISIAQEKQPGLKENAKTISDAHWDGLSLFGKTVYMYTCIIPDKGIVKPVFQLW